MEISDAAPTKKPVGRPPKVKIPIGTQSEIQFDDPIKGTKETQTEKAKEPVIVINSNNKTKKTKTEKAKVQKKHMSLKPTEAQKWRNYQTYTKNVLDKYDVEDPNNDLVQAIKQTFGEDNNKNITTLPTFSYEDDVVRQRIAKDLFDTEQKLIKGRDDASNANIKSATEKIQKVFRGHNVRYDIELKRKQFEKFPGGLAGVAKTHITLKTNDEDGRVGHVMTPVKMAITHHNQMIRKETFAALKERTKKAQLNHINAASKFGEVVGKMIVNENKLSSTSLKHFKPTEKSPSQALIFE